ncbi:MAG: DUF1688 family protein [Betaproteobacteria bacterium]|nr:DUF1688 family protein [Betaproteobacteria bacterium]
MSAAVATSEPEGWHTPVPDGHPAAALLCADAVRRHCREVAGHVAAGRSAHFRVHRHRLADAARYVADVIRARYPDLAVPYHSRWRHIEAGGVDRWGALAARHGLAGDEAVRAMIDLVIPSVLLDAGAGARWAFRDAASGQVLTRSEGLGVASVALFASGVLSNRANAPLRADAEALMRVRAGHVHKFFQVDDDTNPLVGLEGRANLVRQLGVVAHATPAVFGAERRLGCLFDYCRAHAAGGALQAGFVLETLLKALGPLWPGREILDGVPLGDCWPHPAASGGRVPFHKLTQWLTYSLLEPLAAGGLRIEGLDALTGLPEYRNGGLLLDLGVIEPADPALAARRLAPGSEAIVEWRALTVVLLDEIAVEIRALLGKQAGDFPLTCVLEGGTWAAGRRIAAQMRAGGAPPLDIDSDGTVF